jgi:hypothetical protein
MALGIRAVAHTLTNVGDYVYLRRTTSRYKVLKCTSDMSNIGSYMNEFKWMLSGVIRTTFRKTLQL